MILEGCYQAKLNDQVITIRPLVAAKKQTEQQLIAGGKAQYFRFFSSRESLLITSHQTDGYRDKSSKHRLGFIASGMVREREEVIGICHLDLLQYSQACELSIFLSAVWLNQGAARALCQKALEFAHERGVREFYYHDLAATRQLGMELGLIAVAAEDSSLNGIVRAFMPDISINKPKSTRLSNLLTSRMSPSPLPQPL